MSNKRIIIVDKKYAAILNAGHELVAAVQRTEASLIPDTTEINDFIAKSYSHEMGPELEVRGYGEPNSSELKPLRGLKNVVAAYTKEQHSITLFTSVCNGVEVEIRIRNKNDVDKILTNVQHNYAHAKALEILAKLDNNEAHKFFSPVTTSIENDGNIWITALENADYIVGGVIPAYEKWHRFDQKMKAVVAAASVSCM